MPRNTDAYQAFRRNIARPKALQAMFDAGSLKPKKGERRSSGKPTKQENELLRASVIVAIGALDAYLSDVAAEVLVAQLESMQPRTEQARSLLQRILKDMATLPLELALMSDPKERKAVITDALRDHLTTKVSNHGSKGVNAAMIRMGTEFNWARVDRKIPTSLALSGDPTSSARLLDAWTARRHVLVHQGKALKIKSPRARGLVAFVETIAEEVDRLAISAMDAT